MYSPRLLVLALSTLVGCATASGEAADSGPRTDLDGSASSDGSLVDANPSVDASPSSIDAAPSVDAAGNVCLNPVGLTQGTLGGQSTQSASDSLSPTLGNGCPSGGLNSGPDVVYFVQPTVDTLYEITVSPDNGSFDPMLYAMTSCDFAIGCTAGTVLNGPGEDESILFSAGANERIHVVVDGESGSSGPFAISVTATPL